MTNKICSTELLMGGDSDEIRANIGIANTSPEWPLGTGSLETDRSLKGDHRWLGTFPCRLHGLFCTVLDGVRANLCGSGHEFACKATLNFSYERASQLDA